MLGDILFGQANENVLPKTNIHKEGLHKIFAEMLLSEVLSPSFQCTSFCHNMWKVCPVMLSVCAETYMDTS